MSISGHRFLLGTSVVGGLIVTACSSAAGPTGPDSAVVAYSVTNAFTITVDSVTYDNGHGTLVTVIAPGQNYAATLGFAIPGSIGGTVFCHGQGATTYRVVWTIKGQTRADSATANASSPGSFALELPHHSL